MAQEEQMLIVMGFDGDESTPVVASTSYTDTSVVAMQIKDMVPQNPPGRYFVVPSLPFNYSDGLAVNFEGAPYNATVGENKAQVDAMLANPAPWQARCTSL